MPQSNTSLTDYSHLATNEQVAKLALNGVLMSDNQDYLLRIVSVDNHGQLLTDFDAPIETATHFEIVEKVIDEPSTIKDSFCAVGAPGQVYSYAIDRFNRVDSAQ